MNRVPAELEELQTPALLVDADAFEHNLAAMAAYLPGPRLRPHVKAHKSTEMARRQAGAGHLNFTCATIREVEVMAAAGLGHDLLLANEVVDARRLGDAAERFGARVTLAVDSEATIEAAATGGVREVLVDVNVGLPRCGCALDEAGRLADLARERGIEVRGVMGYEGHVVGKPDRSVREREVADSMALLSRAAELVGGDVISAGGTGTYDINTWATEIQAGSYALMDTAYDELSLPFRQAVTLLATVISVSAEHAVADCGLKALSMDHGLPSMGAAAKVWFCSDEHVTFAPAREHPVRVGDRVRLTPSHIDPTVACHAAFHVVQGGTVIDTWPVDMRGW